MIELLLKGIEQRRIPQPELGRVMQKARQRAKLTLRDVAAELGVSHQIVSYWERGTRQPSNDVLSSLCTLYQVSAEYFLQLDIPAAPSEMLGVFYSNLKRCRTRQGIPQSRLAELAKIPVTTIKAYETPHSGILLSECTLRAICDALGFSFDETATAVTTSDALVDAAGEKYRLEFTEAIQKLNKEGMRVAARILRDMEDLPKYTQGGNNK